jgi:hypothetical protein
MNQIQEVRLNSRDTIEVVNIIHGKFKHHMMLMCHPPEAYTNTLERREVQHPTIKHRPSLSGKSQARLSVRQLKRSLEALLKPCAGLKCFRTARGQ